MGVVGVVTLVTALAFRRRLDSFATFWVFLVVSVITMVLSLVFRSGTLFFVLLMTVVTTVAMFYIGAAGIWSSTASSSSWRSLLSTMGIG